MDSSRISGRADIFMLDEASKVQGYKVQSSVNWIDKFVPPSCVTLSTNFQQIFVPLVKNNLTNFADKRQLRSSLMDSCINEIVQSSFVSQISSLCAFTVEITNPFSIHTNFRLETWLNVVETNISNNYSKKIFIFISYLLPFMFSILNIF